MRAILIKRQLLKLLFSALILFYGVKSRRSYYPKAELSFSLFCETILKMKHFRNAVEFGIFPMAEMLFLMQYEIQFNKLFRCNLFEIQFLYHKRKLLITSPKCLAVFLLTQVFN